MPKRDLKNYIRKFDLTDIQAEIYLALLKCGPTKVSELSRLTSIKRVSCYTALEKLKALGYVNEELKKYGRKVSALPPSQLKQLLGDRKRQLRRLEIDFDKFLPELETLRKSAKKDRGSGLLYYEGKDALINLWMGDLLDDGKLIRGFSTEKIKRTAPDIFDEFVPKRVEKGVYAKAIVPDEKTTREFQKTDKRFLRETRILKGGFDLDAIIGITEKGVYIASWFEPIFCVVIKNQFIVKNFTSIFDAMWNNLTKE